MARTRYGSDKGLSARMAGTMFGLGLLYVIIAAVLIAIGVNAVFVLAISAAMLFGQWWFSDSMAMAAMRAVVVTPEQAPQLHAMVDRICAMANMPKPRRSICRFGLPALSRTTIPACLERTSGIVVAPDLEISSALRTCTPMG